MNRDEYILKNLFIVSMVHEDEVYKGSIHIKDKKIFNMYRKDEKLPKDIMTVNMKEKYVIPGLSDMHVHFHDVKQSKAFLAYGVTLVRVMAGSEMHLIRRDSIKNQRILGPEMVVGTPIVDDPDPYWPTLSIVIERVDEVRLLIENWIDRGYDFFKVYNNLSKDVFNEILEVSQELNFPVAVHVSYFLKNGLWISPTPYI